MLSEESIRNVAHLAEELDNLKPEVFSTDSILQELAEGSAVVKMAVECTSGFTGVVTINTESARSRVSVMVRDIIAIAKQGYVDRQEEIERELRSRLCDITGKSSSTDNG